MNDAILAALSAALGESDGSAADAKTVAHNGELLTYQGQTSVDGWNLVVYNNANGWVSGKYSRVEA